MKKIDFELVLAFILSLVPITIITWFIYKIFLGIYHLLDKLIDKI